MRLLYQTVLLDKDGDPIVRGDPYGWNDRIATALGFGVAGAAHLRAGSGDLGP